MCLVPKAGREVPAWGAGGHVVGCEWISLYSTTKSCLIALVRSSIAAARSGLSLTHAQVAGSAAPAAAACALQPLDGCDWLVVMRTGTFFCGTIVNWVVRSCDLKSGGGV